MSAYTNIWQEFNRQVVDVNEQVVQQRASGADANTVQKVTDQFLIDWSLKLTDERERLIEAAQQEIDMNEPRSANSNTIFAERERAAKVNTAQVEAAVEIKQAILDLRGSLIAAVQDISKGRTPNLALEPMPPAQSEKALLSGQTVKPESWEELISRKQREMPATPVPEHNQAQEFER
ncbi:hypothetical protein CCAX7_46220 [Capsulimonas corticalis]|uniref:Uncharacterized protein n=1 Tax=Capsulimonas corticalis TaxID=2219043 RepID=A0A402D544_9BACT|nr:hypothetical protein [Capsulimonas corticalis]BDI32571.1 hypothetical protein CCAX7_46220 [Capsulimonas corticalis]